MYNRGWREPPQNPLKVLCGGVRGPRDPPENRRKIESNRVSLAEMAFFSAFQRAAQAVVVAGDEVHNHRFWQGVPLLLH